ncbi:hypothetical protein ABTK16_20105, partial [Acinetobacter baumannii]
VVIRSALGVASNAPEHLFSEARGFVKLALHQRCARQKGVLQALLTNRAVASRSAPIARHEI